MANLTYEEWVKHLEEKERAKKPKPKPGSIEFFLELLDRFGDIFA